MPHRGGYIMAFCINCGKELIDGAKFCFECGVEVGISNMSSERRKTKYDGEIHKCPNCGDTLDAYEAVCECCGYERRGMGGSSSVKEFATQLKNANSSYQKVAVIQGFPIPNNREDILEFFILASSSISDHMGKAVLNAWVAKVEQSYNKVKLVLKDDADRTLVDAIYSATKQKVKQINRKKEKRLRRKLIIPIAVILGFLSLPAASIALVLGMESAEDKKIQKENDRLDAVVDMVYEALENDNYVLARATAATLVFSGPDDPDAEIAAMKWDKTRVELLDIIDKAEYGTDYTPVARKLKIGIGYGDVESKQYFAVKKQFEERGFTNIKAEPIDNWLTGWWTSEGLVEKVTVDGNAKFTKDTECFSDVEIIIYYHALDSLEECTSVTGD